MSFLTTTYFIGLLFTGIAVAPFLINFYKTNAPTNLFLLTMIIPFIPIVNLIVPTAVMIFTVLIWLFFVVTLLDFFFRETLWR